MMITQAATNDESTIRKILSEASLPNSDIDLKKQDFLMVKEGNEVIGIAGIEIYGNIGLLRSFAIHSAFRNKGLGSELYRKMQGYAISKEINELYLLTTTAEKFFTKLGFVVIPREDVPESVRKSEEFANICPASALCMKKKISNKERLA